MSFSNVFQISRKHFQVLLKLSFPGFCMHSFEIKTQIECSFECLMTSFEVLFRVFISMIETESSSMFFSRTPCYFEVLGGPYIVTAEFSVEIK